MILPYTPLIFHSKPIIGGHVSRFDYQKIDTHLKQSDFLLESGECNQIAEFASQKKVEYVMVDKTYFITKHREVGSNVVNVTSFK